MTDRYPGYDVLTKRNSPSWNDQTRRVVDERLAIDPGRHRFCNDSEWLTLTAICEQVVPQPADRAHPVPIAAMLDEKLCANSGDGYRNGRLPSMREAWRRGLRAFEAEARERHGCAFHQLAAAQQVALLTAVQNGQVDSPAWGDMPPALFFTDRLLHDIVSAYYAHPTAWNEIGFGGPASPRGYVRLDFDRRDPWEAAEARPGSEYRARSENARVG
ncbi:MAG: gluconate 2-dehydrogenase subunit 3 family protein [Proteobacteria bacterium]|nr:gluconate 2-dehydrogenase subunit 3 family protein [Pseudomonadota bacterium]